MHISGINMSLQYVGHQTLNHALRNISSDKVYPDYVGDDLEGFLASEDEAEVTQPAKRSRTQAAAKQCAAKARLDWSDSSSGESEGRRSSQQNPTQIKASVAATKAQHGGRGQGASGAERMLTPCIQQCMVHACVARRAE